MIGGERDLPGKGESHVNLSIHKNAANWSALRCNHYVRVRLWSVRPVERIRQKRFTSRQDLSGASGVNSPHSSCSKGSAGGAKQAGGPGKTRRPAKGLCPREKHNASFRTGDEVSDIQADLSAQSQCSVNKPQQPDPAICAGAHFAINQHQHSDFRTTR